MILTLKQFEINDHDDMINALIDLAEIDADFSGENGKEYLRV